MEQISTFTIAILLFIAFSGTLYALYRTSTNNKRAGSTTTRISLTRMPPKTVATILFISAALLMAAGCYEYIDNRESIPITIFLGIVLLSSGYTLYQSSFITIGAKGFSTFDHGVILWNDIQNIKWDKDVGQRLWGFSVLFTKNDKVHRIKLYINRLMKYELEEKFSINKVK